MTKQFDIEAFKVFVGSKDPSERYDGVDVNRCALAQFGLRVGLGDLHRLGISRDVYRAAVWHGSTPDRLEKAPNFYTFGALAERLNSLPAAPSLPSKEGDVFPCVTLSNSERETLLERAQSLCLKADDILDRAIPR